MNTKILNRTSTLVVCGAVALAVFGCNQQKPRCASGRGDFSARYTLVSGLAPCADVKGEKLGIQTYNDALPSGNPDLDHASVAIQGENLGLLVQNAAAGNVGDGSADHHPYAFGAFTSNQPNGDFCDVPSLIPATQALPAVAADKANKVDEQAATTVTYDWSNVRFYVTSGAYGTQMQGNVTITTDGLACHYNVFAMYPYVDCSKKDPNNAKNMIADPDACLPDPDPQNGRPVGSGINPDFPVQCDPVLLTCMPPTDALPSLK